MVLTQAKFGYQAQLHELTMLEFDKEDFKLNYEISTLGADVGDGFGNTWELKAMKYKEAMTVDRDGWTTAVDEEHQQMIDNKVRRPVKWKMYHQKLRS
eukprot:6457853-Ditylum_brightwellii.AAC.1